MRPALSTFSIAAGGSVVKNGIIEANQPKETSTFHNYQPGRNNGKGAAGAASCPIYGTPKRPAPTRGAACMVLA